MWGREEGVDTARWACGAGRPSMLVCRVGIGADTISRDAPQASVGISWRDAADNLICLMIIRRERRRGKGEREREREEKERRPQKEKRKEDPQITPILLPKHGKFKKK